MSGNRALRVVSVVGVAAAAMLLRVPMGWAAYRNVPAAYPTIQAAIDAAAPGDDVVLAPGTYTGSGNRNIDFLGKAITVRGSDPTNAAVVAATVINCQGSSSSPRRGFVLRSGEGAGSVLAGLTIRNGYGPLESYEGEMLSAGGGLYIRNASPTIRDCVIRDCGSGYWGGGAWCLGGSPTFTRCTFQNNTSVDTGGGLYCNLGNPQFTACSFSGNSSGYGGGIYVLDGSVALTRCILAGNSATAAGGAFRIKGAVTASLSSCLLQGNSGPRGAGLHVTDAAVNMANCTLAGNGATIRGGGAWCNAAAELLATNTIIWGNTAPSGPQAALEGYSTFTVSYGDVQGGLTGVYVEAGSIASWNYGSITGNPLFADADGPDNNAGTWADNDYHLAATSPCIDVADPGTWYGGGARDIDGDPRLNGTRADIGADESPRWRAHNVTRDTWYSLVQPAIDAAAAGDEIVVTPATNYETLTLSGKTLRSADPGDPTCVARTIIDGSLGASATVTISANATLDGLTITGGTAGIGHPDDSVWVSRCAIRTNRGTGIRSHPEAGTLFLSRCAVVSNADSGIMLSSDARLTAASCVISGNTTSGVGGGICMNYCMYVNLRNCLLAGNSASKGGAVYWRDSYLTMANCTIVGNSAGQGGALYAYASVSVNDYVHLHNSVVWGNTSLSGQPIVLHRNGSLDRFVASCNDVEGGQAAVQLIPDPETNLVWSVTWSPDNINADPLFADAVAPGLDYRLRHGSPCINTGDNALAVAATDTTNAGGTATTLVVADITRFAVGDQVDYDGKGVLRTVTQVNAGTSTVTVSPALPVATQAGKTVRNYGPGDLDGRNRILLSQVDRGAYELEPLYTSDVTADGCVDVQDLLTFAASWAKSYGEPGYDAACDFNGDGQIDVEDLLTLAGDWGQCI